MTQPGVPSLPNDSTVELPCGETVSTDDLDLGMREYECECGSSHAVVLDPHPPTRFLPETVTDVLVNTLQIDGREENRFDTNALMGLVQDRHSDRIVTLDAAEDGTIGFALAWIADFDSYTLHEIVVETVLELMSRAVDDGGNESARKAFTEHRADLDVEAFVSQYREVRNFDAESANGGT